MTSAIIFGLLIALMLTGMPISIALGLTVLTFVFTMTQVPIESVALKLFTGIERFEIMAVPFFILAGTFLTHGGVARRMIDFATSVVGHWHGGLALAGIVACAMFALVCGSSVATVVAIGSIVPPEMVRRGYPMHFGAGIITVAGSLGILMLPSIPKVIYAISTNTSIGALFVAGLLPGMLLTTMLCTVTWYIARKRNYPRLPKSTWTQSWRAFRQSVWGLMLVVIIIGGIYSGVFTATEAAAMAAVYNFMEPSSIILIMAPILFPTAKRLGIDPVHFGIVIDVNMEVGLCHPPVGLNLYVASTIARLGITELTAAVLPWLVTMLLFLLIVTYWPELTLWLPRVLGML